MSTRTSLGFLSTANRKEGRYSLPWLSQPPPSCAAAPARLLPSLSEAPREPHLGGRTIAKLPSLYLHSLPSPTRLPTPTHTTVSTAPLHGQSGALGGPAHARSSDAAGAESHLSCLQLVRWRFHRSSATPISGKHRSPGLLAVVRRLCGGKVRANVSRRRRCLVPSPDRRRTHTWAAFHASVALCPLSRRTCKSRLSVAM